MAGLIGRAGPGLAASEIDIGAHHAARHFGLMGRKSDAAGMEEVERADIEGRGNADPAAVCDEALGEGRAAIAVIETAIDVSRRDVGQIGRAEHARRAEHDPHGHRGRSPVAAGQHGVVGHRQLHHAGLRFATVAAGR